MDNPVVVIALIGAVIYLFFGVRAMSPEEHVRTLEDRELLEYISEDGPMVDVYLTEFDRRQKIIRRLSQ